MFLRLMFIDISGHAWWNERGYRKKENVWGFQAKWNSLYIQLFCQVWPQGWAFSAIHYLNTYLNVSCYGPFLCTFNSKRSYTLCFRVSTQNVIGGLGPQPGFGWGPIGVPTEGCFLSLLYMWFRINYSARQYYISETYFSDWSITICKIMQRGSLRQWPSLIHLLEIIYP